MIALDELLKDQLDFSITTFGGGERKKAVIDHIKKEIIELEETKDAASEWVDIILLAIDGLLRAEKYNTQLKHGPLINDQAAILAAVGLINKLSKNRTREWPDWRDCDPEKAIEHVRGHHDR